MLWTKISLQWRLTCGHGNSSTCRPTTRKAEQRKVATWLREIRKSGKSKCSTANKSLLRNCSITLRISHSSANPQLFSITVHCSFGISLQCSIHLLVIHLDLITEPWAWKKQEK